MERNNIKGIIEIKKCIIYHLIFTKIRGHFLTRELNPYLHQKI